MKTKKENLLVMDAEWIPVTNTLDELKESNIPLYEAWFNRCVRWNKEKMDKGEQPLSPEEYYESNASKYPEFLKIICISYAYYTPNGQLKKGSFYGNDEKVLLNQAKGLFDAAHKNNLTISGAGITRFDMPFISKRMMINGIIPPANLSVYGQKPWDVKHFDLIEVWGQGCRQEAFTPLEWICISLGIPSPKEDISGADVKRVYYEEGASGLERIKEYCEKDVDRSVQVADKLINLMPV